MDLSLALAAVVARPRDDEPRLRFADLVAATEPATAAFVRAQVELARRRRLRPRRDRNVERGAVACGLPAPAHDARGLDRVATMLRGTVPDWAQRLAYGRGFVERATVSAPWFAERGTDLVALAPVIDLTVHDPPDDATELFDSPAWAQARSLRFSGRPPSPGTIRALVGSPYLSRLAVLDIAQAGLPGEAIELLAGAASLRGLRYLRAHGNEFPDPNPSLDEQDGQVFGERPSAFASQLRGRLGPLAWLDGIPQESEPHPEALG